MSFKHFIIPALLGVASCLVTTNLALAGHGGGHGGGGHGGGGHGGGHMGGGHMGGGHHVGGGGFYGGGLGYGGFGYGGLGGYGYGLGGYGLGGYGYGLGGLGYGYGGGGYGYGGGGYGGGYGSNYLSAGYGYGSPQYSYYPANAMPAQPSYIQPAPAIPPGAGQVRVIVPDPTAQVTFDGAATQQTGTDRYFHTPALTVGSTYTYRIRASWQQNGKEAVQERQVTVMPGQTSVADFR